MRNFPVSLESRRSENSRNRVVRISVGVGQDAEGTLRNTRGSTVERLERKPCDLSLIGGARPADWLTRKTLNVGAVSRDFISRKCTLPQANVSTLSSLRRKREKEATATASC
ncbi:hypothetical protein HZH66_002106 [Vespula vulgaris]|uniref:Uncharacterized protein n=1 Tax=Vespula vulgaris TaxID=7454 RepID=A0A834NGZ4_VESVU|nr:hypothetical protein HZH66_002106 [Vespula vulgaris]